MSAIIEKNLPCLNPGCGSSDARQRYTEGNSYCFSCKTYFSKAQEEKALGSKDDEIIEIEEPVKKPKSAGLTVETVKAYAHRGFAERKIRKETCEFFKVTVSYNQSGEISDHYYPYSGGGYKHRRLPKTFTWVGPSGGLFGKDLFQGGGKRVVITEGEIDALSVAQAIFDKYKKWYPVVSLASSAATKDLIPNREWLRSFDEVVLFLDSDKAGEEATQKAIKIIGIDKVKVVKSPAKDASEIMQKHSMEEGSKIINDCIWDAQSWSPAGIISKEDIWKQIVEAAKTPSVPYPSCLAGLNSKLKGMRLGEIALFISGTGCFAKGTEILMADGTLRAVENVAVGEYVAGDDGVPKLVKTLFRGREQMVRVTLRDGTSFVANKSHVISVVNNDNEGRWGLTQNQVVDVTIEDYAAWSPKRKHLSKAFKSTAIEFPKQDLSTLHPYVLGVWLGDGYSDGGRFACQESDRVIIDSINSLGYNIYKGAGPFVWNAPGRLRAELVMLNLKDNKHIPEQYLISDVKDRLELLAGLLDTDGSYDSARGGYEFSQKRLDTTLAVKRLCESLGFAATVGKQFNNKFGNCYRLYIFGEGLEHIPCRLPRKQARPRLQKKASNRYSFTLDYLEEDDFYGFEVDGNGRFVLGNFVVTHNSGKSTITREIELHLLEVTTDKIGIISLEESPGETGKKLAGMHLCRNPANEEIPEEELKEGFDAVFASDRLVVLDHQGAIKDDSIVDQLEYMCLIGCKYLIIDHITILVSEGAEGLAGNEAIDLIMNNLLRLVKRHNVWIGLVSHLRKVQNGKVSFEEGRLPSMDDIRGCLAKDTGVIKSDGKRIAVQDVTVGTKLIGDKGKPVEVISLCRGIQQMYKVTMKRSGDYFICNEDHVLTLSHNDAMFDISVKDFLKQSDAYQMRCKQHYSEGYELEEQPLLIPPYAFGAWLGDGSKSAFRVMDASTLGIAARIATDLGAVLLEPSDINREYFNFDTGIKGDLLNKLKELDVYCNKHIPDCYRYNSIKNRLELLAGLLDTDGTFSERDGYFRFYQKDINTANAVCEIAKSLGFFSTINSNLINGHYASNGSTIYCVTISGDIEEIPAQKLGKVNRHTNALKRGITIEKLNVQDYYGFTLTGNGRFLLDNHIVTHNSGSIKQVSFDVIAFARNMMAEEEQERNTIKMAVLKSRTMGQTGQVPGAIYSNITSRLTAEEENFDDL